MKLLVYSMGGMGALMDESGLLLETAGVPGYPVQPPESSLA